MKQKIGLIACGVASMIVSSSAFAIDWYEEFLRGHILQGENISIVGDLSYITVQGAGRTGITQHASGHYTIGNGRFIITPTGDVVDCDLNRAECVEMLKNADASSGGGDSDGSAPDGDAPDGDAPDGAAPGGGGDNNGGDEGQAPQMSRMTQQQIEYFARLGLIIGDRG